ncbi:nucleotide-sugar transporter-domain-containing protein [Lobosporangium transversale]|uniref:Nucleotide-sugar transporter-domain-containing protein n=1 Tax=Lobosporangium transversale TaxID=64571 RepID=A0A1Y2GLZ1_9FUNG|nr:nucleotide-sugar transporter-domain-containing protein [Lobosporangium transversale]ORZ14871.1 nucleotide-sugar transporter-domain-containing protein [Lobosporangium transversale]|eukprot:XP_021881003.1 nucleotide-sugar transporter-domain-containing protein [Lobosporangium transversale]
MPSSTSSTSCSFPPILLFAVPGAIYFFNNNLTFVLLSLMPAPTYVVLSNLKILTTGLFSYLFLHRLLTSAQWISLGILFLSTAVSQIDLEKGLSLSISIQAFLLMILFCSLSAAASVFSEYVMKERFANESIHLQNMKLYMFGILFNGITYMLTPAPANSLGSAAVESSSFFSDTAPIHFMIIMAYASLGLVTSAIIKFSGSITKVYASSMSMFFAALVSWLLLNDQLTVLFFVGCFGCCFALHLYYRAPVPSQAPESTTSLLTDDRDDGDDDDKEEPRRDSSSSYASSTTLAASPGVEPTKHKNINSPDAILTSVTVVDRNEYFSLDTLDDGGKRPQ